MTFLDHYRAGKRLRDKLFSLAAGRSFRRFGRNSVICLPVRIGGECQIEIGSGSFIGPNCWIESLDPTAAVPVITIGSGVSLSGFTTITAVSRVVIGDHALIARCVHISDHSHAFAGRDLPVKQQGIDKIAPVHIGEGAWLGHGVVVCPGVTIGRNAVIGANSVVRDDVPDYCVAAGVPAKIIRRPTSVPVAT